MSKNSVTGTTKRGATTGANQKSTAKDLHVVPHTEGWVIRREGSTRASSLHSTQRAAVEAARELAEKYSITLVIHGRDGRVKERNSFSHDPMPPREPRKVLYPTTPPRTSREAIKKAVRKTISETAGTEPKKRKSSLDEVHRSR